MSSNDAQWKVGMLIEWKQSLRRLMTQLRSDVVEGGNHSWVCMLHVRWECEYWVGQGYDSWSHADHECDG
ncbi:hypothetical protein AMTR_s00120p00108140 [Amborella trichopoda]|uniref:Uncharacterized protein n=1 Tax=Amborella trichopoda TaxID=13333 RepID=W1NT13_AMBTC|nr:hypothetical protein AMTR_s00120p00108140 [Amborella trichopoda]